MATHASLRYLRMAPRKLQVVADAIRGEPIAQALDYLKFSRKRAAKPMTKLLKSAIANASQEKGVDVDNLVVKELTVGGGPSMKRWMPRARGTATPVLKRTSHVTIVLGEK